MVKYIKLHSKEYNQDEFEEKYWKEDWFKNVYSELIKIEASRENSRLKIKISPDKKKLGIIEKYRNKIIQEREIQVKEKKKVQEINNEYRNDLDNFLDKYAPSQKKEKRNIICKIDLQKREIYLPQEDGKMKSYSLDDFPVKNPNWNRNEKQYMIKRALKNLEQMIKEIKTISKKTSNILKKY